MEEHSVTDAATDAEERAFMRAAIADLEAGRELPLAAAKSRFGLK
jgi:cell division protein FtsB